MVASLTQVWSPREAYEFVTERDHDGDLALDATEVDPTLLARYDSQTEGIPGRLEIWEVMEGASRLAPTGINPDLIQREKEAGGRWSQLFRSLHNAPFAEPWWEASLAVRDYLGRGRTFEQAVATVDGVLQLFPQQGVMGERYWARRNAFDKWTSIVIEDGADPDWYAGLVRALPQDLRDQPNWYSNLASLWRQLCTYGDEQQAMSFIDTVATRVSLAAQRAFEDSVRALDGLDGPHVSEKTKQRFVFAFPEIMVHPNGRVFIDYAVPAFLADGYSDWDIAQCFHFYADDERAIWELPLVMDAWTKAGFSIDEVKDVLLLVGRDALAKTKGEVLESLWRAAWGLHRIHADQPKGDHSLEQHLLRWCLTEGRSHAALYITTAGQLGERGFDIYDIKNMIVSLVAAGQGQCSSEREQGIKKARLP